jgi:hypothetical protein
MNRIILEKRAGSQLVKKVPPLDGTTKVYQHVEKSRSRVPFLTQINEVHPFTSCFLEMYF